MLLRVSRENGMPPRKAAEDMVRPPVAAQMAISSAHSGASQCRPSGSF
jgi:hypothetical protein